MSDFIPNSFQTPNDYVDQFMHLLSGEEYKVLSYMVRRLFGFNKRQDRISISQLVKGLKTKDGRRLDHGTGLTENAATKALHGLVDFRFLVVLAPANAARQEAPLFALQLDSNRIDVMGLEERQREEKEARRRKTSKARNAFQVQKSDTYPCAQPQPSTVVHKGSPSLVHNPSPPLVDNPPQYTSRNTEGNPESTEEEFDGSNTTMGNHPYHNYHNHLTQLEMKSLFPEDNHEKLYQE